jgi:DNA-directed RNA polymerase subunit RPC12/RpoP
MGYKFKCGKCRKEILVKWLKPGEVAHCRHCGEKMPVPASPEKIANNLVDAVLPEHEAGPVPAPRPACPSCRYLERSGADFLDGAGFCHRYPPDSEGRYPSVTASDWCGEYAEKY